MVYLWPQGLDLLLIFEEPLKEYVCTVQAIEILHCFPSSFELFFFDRWFWFVLVFLTSIGGSLIREAVVLSCLNVFGFDQSSSLQLKGWIVGVTQMVMADRAQAYR